MLFVNSLDVVTETQLRSVMAKHYGLADAEEKIEMVKAMNGADIDGKPERMKVFASDEKGYALDSWL